MGTSPTVETAATCPTSASTIAYLLEVMPGIVAVPLGAFAGEDVPTPAFSVWEECKQPWIEIVGEGIERHA